MNTNVNESEQSDSIAREQTTPVPVASAGSGNVLELSLQVVELDGTPGLQVGEQFDVYVDFTDIRDPGNLQSVFSAYADFVFDPAVLRVDSLSYAAGFANLHTGTIDNGAGLVDEAGATPTVCEHIAVEMGYIRPIRMQTPLRQ